MSTPNNTSPVRTRGRIRPHTPNTETRIKMVKAMEFICAHINNEDILETWLSLGVADGDISYGDLEVRSHDPEMLYPYYEEDENFAQLMGLFQRVMFAAWNDGGLYCDRVVSK